ncbi:protachykinin-1-like [Glossophaga mutica]
MWVSRLKEPGINTVQHQAGRKHTATFCSTTWVTEREERHARAQTIQRKPAGLSTTKSSLKILVALVVFFLVSTQWFAEEIEANDDLNYWSNWCDSSQTKEAAQAASARAASNCLLLRISQSVNPHWKLFELMGKLDAGSSSEKQVALLKALHGHGLISHKSHKTNSFVGLMGKRVFNSAYERSEMQNSERRCK